MIESILYLSPFGIMGGGVLLLLLCYLRESSTGVSFRLAKIFTVIGFGASVIFYNRSAFPEMMQANYFSLMFLVLMFAAMCATLFLSRKWYSSMNISGSLFCCGLLLSGFAGLLLVMSENLGLTFCSIGGLLVANYLLFIHADKRKEVYVSSRLYALSALTVWALMTGITVYLGSQNADLTYASLETYFENNTESGTVFAVAAAIVLVFAFLVYRDNRTNCFAGVYLFYTCAGKCVLGGFHKT